LHANLALALLFSGKSSQAWVVARESLAKDPADKITAQIVRIIEEVVGGYAALSSSHKRFAVWRRATRCSWSADIKDFSRDENKHADLVKVPDGGKKTRIIEEGNLPQE
jgi:hypothetical protein